MNTDKDKKNLTTDENPKQYVKASHALKRKIVNLVSNGRISKRAASIKYNVSRSSIDYWMDKFATLDEKQTFMSKDKELKKLKERIEELEFIKDFQQDLIAEFEIETGDIKSKKCLPGHLAKEIEQRRKKAK
jgi:transposase